MRSRWIKWMLLIAAGLMPLCSARAAPAVAMVTDLQGQATVDGGGGQQKRLAILSELEPGGLVHVLKGALLVLVYLESGDEFTLRGATDAYIRQNGPMLLRGAPIERRRLSLGDGTEAARIKPVGFVQAGLVMRGLNKPRVKLLVPVDTRVLEKSPLFAWEPVSEARYRFTLRDNSGHVLVDTPVSGSSFKLPDSVSLQDGGGYLWTIEAIMPDGHKYSNEAKFQMATQTERERAQRMQPAPNAPFSERVVYATWLEQEGMRDEARGYWKELSAERPDDPNLRMAASR
jgi:hypothetical protein